MYLRRLRKSGADPGPPLTAKEKVKQHLIRDKLNSCQRQKPQKIIDHPRVANSLDRRLIKGQVIRR